MGTSKERAMRTRPHPRKDELTDREKTPGTGSLPEKDQPEVDVGPD